MKKKFTTLDLANEFSRLVREQFTPDQLEMVRDRNRTKEYGMDCCATHDFYDANEIMAEAFENVAGEEIDIQDEQQTWLWGNAWTLAKLVEFNNITI